MLAYLALRRINFYIFFKDELEMWKKQSNCKDTELQRQKGIVEIVNCVTWL